jgi:hypothetical protein
MLEASSRQMAPLHGSRAVRQISGKDDVNESGREAMGLEYTILESWSQGVLVGGIVILVLITLANIRRGVLLHKLIFLEVYAFSSRWPRASGNNIPACIDSRPWNVYLLP